VEAFAGAGEKLSGSWGAHGEDGIFKRSGRRGQGGFWVVTGGTPVPPGNWWIMRRGGGGFPRL
jgi:hypothetical protein